MEQYLRNKITLALNTDIFAYIKLFCHPPKSNLTLFKNFYKKQIRKLFN